MQLLNSRFSRAPSLGTFGSCAPVAACVLAPAVAPVPADATQRLRVQRSVLEPTAGPFASKQYDARATGRWQQTDSKWTADRQSGIDSRVDSLLEMCCLCALCADKHARLPRHHSKLQRPQLHCCLQHRTPVMEGDCTCNPSCLAQGGLIIITNTHGCRCCCCCHAPRCRLVPATSLSSTCGFASPSTSLWCTGVGLSAATRAKNTRWDGWCCMTALADCQPAPALTGVTSYLP